MLYKYKMKRIILLALIYICCLTTENLHSCLNTFCKDESINESMDLTISKKNLIKKIEEMKCDLSDK